MTATDRVFRALGRAVPESILGLVDAFAPGIVPEGVSISPAHVDDPHLDVPPPPLDADWLARAGPLDLLHVECQGYRDTGFRDRVFHYHIRLVARYPDLRVHTIALWLIPPPPAQRIGSVRRGDVSVRITSLVLPRLPAATLLVNPRTACFAAGADAGASRDEELCARVAAALRIGQASWHERQVACVVAAVRGRYKEMVKAMRQENVEPAMIEDLVKYGEDVGYERGHTEGRSEGLADGLVALYEARFGAVPAAIRGALASTRDAETLRRWYAVLSTEAPETIEATVLGRRPS